MAPSHSHSTQPVTFTSMSDLTLTVTSANTVTYTTTPQTTGTYDVWFNTSPNYTFYASESYANYSTYTTPSTELLPPIDVEDVAWEDMPQNQA